tara:strand:- start:766 stop:1695 length:930 start_codon:yes stop_codon:yes gene_type:complete
MGSLSAQLTSNPSLWLALMGLLGLTMGSFACVVVLRLPVRLMSPLGDTTRLPQANQPNDSNYSRRSRCPNCNHELRWLDLIPVLSWLVLRGQCAHCKQAISKLYPILELMICAWFIWCTYAVIAQPLTTLHPTATALAWSMWGTVLLCCLLIDARYMLLPDVLTLPLLAMGLMASAASLTPLSFQASCTGAGAAWLVLWAIAKCYHLTTNRHGMGQGDIKLFAALGAWQGLEALPWILLGASLVGTVVGAVSHHRKTTQIDTPTPTRAAELGLDAQAVAFGPYLVLCAMLYQVLINLTLLLNSQLFLFG